MAVTRADVARRAGVSPAVVSYVLNPGTRPVATGTRQRVEDAVRDLGYRPDPVARALRGQRTRSVGLLVPDEGNPFFDELAREIEDVAFSEDYVLLIGNAMGQQSREAAYLRTFTDRRVDGIIMISVQSHPQLDIPSAAGVPIVVMDRVAARPGVSTVVADHSGGAALATTHLIEHGHTRVGCVTGPRSVLSAEQRRDGWARAMQDAGLRIESGLVSEHPFTLSGGFDAATTLLGGTHRPTALFVSTDVQALGALSACHRLGLQVPGDVAIICFDGTTSASFSVPPLTTVTQPLQVIAKRAMRHLLDYIANPTTPEKHDVIGVDLTTRESCGCVFPPRARPTPGAGPRRFLS